MIPWCLGAALWRLIHGVTRDDRRLRLSLIVTLIATLWWAWLRWHATP